MPDTPTTEGSIVAYLRLDSSDWDAKLDEAKAKAEELGRLNPTITVRADVADAISKMDAAQLASDELRGDKTLHVTTVMDTVDKAASVAAPVAPKTAGVSAAAAAEDRWAAASERAAKASDAARLAAQAEEVAAMRLEDVQNRRGHTDTQVAAAELALQRAEARTADAMHANVVAGNQLRAVRESIEAADRGAAGAEQDLAAAADAAAKSTGGNSGGGAGYYGVIAGVVAALVPLMGSLAGYVAGVGGAFAGMGVAGVLAMEGVKNAIADGTQMGDQFSTSLTVLKADLGSLEGTAAANVLAPFQEAVQTIHDALPSLNSEMAGFAQQLGVAGDAVVSGLVTGFRVLNPLFTQAGTYIDEIAQGFQHWTQDGGLQKFASFAEQAFPQVASALGSLVDLAARLVEALAPLGGAVLSIITEVASALDSLPLPVLDGVAAAAVAVFVGFRQWQNISPIVSSLTEKIGNLRGGAQALTAVKFAGWFTAAAAAAYALVSGITDVIYSYGPLPGEISRVNDAIAAGDPQKASGDYQKLSGQLDALKTKYGAVVAASTGFAEWLHSHNLDFFTLGSDKQLGAAVDAVNRYKAAVASGAGAQAQFTSTTSGTVVQLGQESSSAVNAQNAVTALSTALGKLGSVNLSASQANIQFQAAMANARASAQQYGAQLDLTTAAGRANQTALDGIASSAVALVAADAKTGASQQSLNSTMASARASFIAVAESMGMSASQAEDLATKDGLIPGEVSTIYQTVGGPQAENMAIDVAAALDQIPRNVLINISANNTTPAAYYGFGPTLGHAAGGRTGHAAGGVVTGAGNAFSDTAGDYYPVSNGEWIVSNRAGQASKWDKMLAAVNQNASPQTVAAQAMRIAGVTSGGTTIVNRNYYATYQITTDNPELAYQYFAQKQNQLAAI